MNAMSLRRWDHLVEVVVNQYNNEKHSSTGMTPEEANKSENHDKALKRMESRAKHNLVRPKINVGDTVRLLKKPEGNRASFRVGEDAWTRTTFKVLQIESTENGNTFTLEHQTKKFLRHEIKLVTGNERPSEQLEDEMITKLNATFDNKRSRGDEAVREVPVHDDERAPTVAAERVHTPAAADRSAPSRPPLQRLRRLSQV